MAKNKAMKLAALLLALTTITTSFVGGTFAKYTTGGNAKDSARVAKWGVNVDITNDHMFKTSYTKSHDDSTITVASSDDCNVVAPGTHGKGVFIKVTGIPEVASKLTFTCSGSDIYINEYHPVEFKLWAAVDGTPIVREVTKGSLEEVMQALNAQSKEYAPNEEINAYYELSWSWKFESGNDDLDTELGNLAASGAETGENFNTLLQYSIDVAVEQVD